MNKLTKLLSVFVLAGAVGTGVAGAVGCNKTPEGPGETHNHEDHLVWVQTEDGKHYQKCTEDDYTTTPEPHDFSNIVCECGLEHSHVYGDWEDGNNGYHTKTCTGCPKELGTYKRHDWNNETGKCQVCGTDQFVNAKFELDVTNDFAVGKTDSDRSSSIFTLGANTEVRTKTPVSVYANEAGGAKIADVPYTSSIKIGDNQDTVTINAPAPGKLTIHAANGSSGTTSGFAKLSFKKPIGSTAPGTIDIVANDMACREIVFNLDKAGEYVIGRDTGTRDIYYISFECEVENTPTEKIKVISSGTDEYFVGQEFTSEAVMVNKVSESKVETPLDMTKTSVTVDSSAVDMTKSGVYTVEINYNDGVNDFKDSYDVTVYAVESLKIGTDKIVKESTNTSAGNGVYANHHLRELYFTGADFDTDGMTVIASASLGEGVSKKTQTFRLKDKDFTLSGNDLSGTGKKTVTVTLKGTTIAETFEVYVMAPVDLSSAETVSVKVDKTINDDAVGTVVSGAYQFKTIHQALEFLEACKAPASAKKTISLAAGLYTEKLEINVPNLTIEGAGTDLEGTYSMIEFDSLYGIEDDGGFPHTTDSTATLNVREKAVGFTIKGVVVSNWFNCVEHFDERLGVGYSEHRALAMLVQADKVTVENCTLLGYQDTLELFTGRHVFKNCLIEGVTDFIFGTNGTTYFTGCEIRSILHANGEVGYVTAFKGENKGKATDSIKYGAIFDGCNFTAEDGATTAIGRAWGSNASVMVMNSTLGEHVVTGAGRYVSMNGNNPANAQFTEYNNTGAGAGATPVQVDVEDENHNIVKKNLWNVLSQADAAKYADMATIFATTNGKVTYADAWDGNAGAKITTEDIDFTEVAKGSSETVGDHFADKLTWAGTGAWNGNSIYVGADTVITLKKAGRVTITWYTGQGTDADALVTYNAQGIATVKILTAGRYIVKLTVDLEDIPAETQTCNVTFNYNYPDAPAANVVVGIIGGKVNKPADPTRAGFNFVHWATADDQEYDFDTVLSGALELKAVWSEMSEEEKDPVIGVPTTISFGDSGNYKTLAAGGKVVIECTNAPRNNGDTNSQLFNGTEITLKVKVGAKVTVASFDSFTNYSVTVNGATVSAGETGTSYEYTVTANKEGEQFAEVVFTSLSDNNYFYSISVSYGLKEISTNKTFNDTTSVESTDEIEFTGVSLHSSSQYWDLGTTGTIKIKVAAGATIKIKSSTWGVGIAVNSVQQTPVGDTITYTSTAGGEIVIGCIESASNRSYIQSIEVSFGA